MYRCCLHRRKLYILLVLTKTAIELLMAGDVLCGPGNRVDGRVRVWTKPHESVDHAWKTWDCSVWWSLLDRMKSV